MKKWIIAICAACVVVLILIVSAKPEPPVDPDDIKPNEVYSHELGVGIRLGMTKRQVDKLLGKGDKINQTLDFAGIFGGALYSYHGSSLYVRYNNDARVSYITIRDGTFIIFNHIAIGDDTEIIPDMFYKASVRSYDYYSITDTVREYPGMTHHFAISLKIQQMKISEIHLILSDPV